MNAPMVIALDAMGGDHAPGMVVDGAVHALQRHDDLRIQLYGDETHIKPLLDGQGPLLPRIDVIHTQDRVLSEDKPSQALRRGRQTSMRLAIDAVRDGSAGAVVSAGNTGALMAMSKVVLKTVPGMDRPAIASEFPTANEPITMLDLGANVGCTVENLVQFAVMGAAFNRVVHGRKRPKVVLLNVGVEELKGHDVIQEAAQVLRDTDLAFEFAGFIEGDDIVRGHVDVVVTDGFSGNIALKTAEGTSKFYSHLLRDAFSSSLLSRLGYLLARSALNKLRDRVDPRSYNGGVFLGLNGISVKSHGGTDGVGFASAINTAHELILGDITERIADDLEKFGGIEEPQIRASGS